MKSDVWLTPREILAPLGKFDFDPCSIHDHPWPVAVHYNTKDSDGLKATWFGRVWLNPPFGREVGKWLLKLADHGNGIALVAARTETKMFFEHVWPRADAICFLRGRPHFHTRDGTRAPFNSGAPIALIAYGENNARVLINSGLGKTLRIFGGA
jgi:hypothetical protein